MPVQSGTEKLLPALYKRTVQNLSMFAFVRGARATLHTVTVEQAVGMFIESYGIDEDNYNVGSAMATYYQMQKELINLNRSTNETD